MKIVVLVKEVPDSYGERRLDPATGRIDRSTGDQVLDEISERSVEVALQVKDRDRTTEVVVLTMGPASAVSSLRKALAMGADRAVHVLDPALEGADALLTARALAAAVRREGFDLVVTGDASSDGAGGAVPGLLAELLGVAVAGSLSEVAIDGGSVRGTRADDGVSTVVSAALPAVIGVTEKVAEARFPGFKGIMTAKRKPLATVGAAELGLAGTAPSTWVESTTQRPPKAAGEKLVDDPEAGRKVAEFLEARNLVPMGS